MSNDAIKENPIRVELEADFLSVLAQPSRLRILYLLREGERCVCEIHPRLPEDASVISRHLVKMREAGLLASRREGVSVYYRIREPRVFEILERVDSAIKAAAQDRARQTAQALPG